MGQQESEDEKAVQLLLLQKKSVVWHKLIGMKTLMTNSFSVHPKTRLPSFKCSLAVLTAYWKYETSMCAVTLLVY